MLYASYLVVFVLVFFNTVMNIISWTIYHDDIIPWVFGSETSQIYTHTFCCEAQEMCLVNYKTSPD